MHPHYHLGLVIASVIIAIVGSSVALFLLNGFEKLTSKAKSLRIVSAGLAFATGTWSMHFVGMLAFVLPTQLAYDSLITICSYLFAVLGAIPAMQIISQKTYSRLQQFEATLFLTIAICIMHYSGMASLKMSPAISYHPISFLASIIVAFVVSYLGLQATEYWQKTIQKSLLPLLVTGVLLGSAVSSMHYTAMSAAHFSPNSISLAALHDGIKNNNLFYAVVCSNLFLMLLLLFMLLADNRVVLWKVLLIVGVSETNIRLVTPLFLPQSLSNGWKTTLDVGFLLLLVSPVAWRLKTTSQSLLSNYKALEKNLEAQQATNQLLSLPVHQWDMEELLNKALTIVFEISCLKTIPKGVIFLNNPLEKKLILVAHHEFYAEKSISYLTEVNACCSWGEDFSQQEISYSSDDEMQQSLTDAHIQHHGHYLLPLLFEKQLLGVLCLYLAANQVLEKNETDILKTFAATMAELIRLKKALEEISLAEIVFKHNLACLLVTDENRKIISVNPIFSKITGYSLNDVLGKNPSILSSGRHDSQFYEQMWKTLAESDRWMGEIWNKRKNGEFYQEWLTITAVRDKKGRIKNYIAVFDDISLRKQHEERIQQLAFFDSLTGLANRTLFYDKLDEAITQAKNHHTKMALLFIDLDRFKEVNDTLGHDAGDELLKTVAKRIQSCLSNDDTLARLGGDEFVIILHDMEDSNWSNPIQISERVAQKIINSLSESHTYNDYTFYGGASIGIVIYPDHAHSIKDLIQLADAAMYEAKSAGRNTYRFFTTDMIEAIKKRVTMTHELRTAIDNAELFLTYQPLVDMTTQTIIGAEVLLRWRSSELGFISPVDFIPLAEDTGLILSIGDWVLEKACQQLSLWIENKKVNLNYLAINISIHQLIHPYFAERLVQICEQFGVARHKLELEITEGGLAQYPNNISEIMEKLSCLGFKLAIDDFGTDYSSLSRLKSFHVDLLKIDRSFVRDMTTDKDDAAIARAVIDLAKALGLTTLAEGVEMADQFELLKQFGCQRAQGFLFGKPMTAQEFERFVSTEETIA